MIHLKGVDDLLRALAAALPSLERSERHRLELRLGGAGTALRGLQRLGDELGVSPWLRWLGPLSRAQVRKQLQDCHWFVLPSRKESFGVVCAEAHACGKPVIAMRAGGTEDVVTEDTGILVRPGEIGELAEALVTAVQTAGRHDSSAIRDHFMQRFSRPVVVDRLESAYRRVVPDA